MGECAEPYRRDYAGETRIVQLWHQLYDVLNVQTVNQQAFTHKYLDLLSAMATSLGYRSLTQTDIDKFYMPQALGDQAQLSLEAQTELLRVLKARPTLRQMAQPPQTWLSPTRLLQMPNLATSDPCGRRRLTKPC